MLKIKHYLIIAILSSLVLPLHAQELSPAMEKAVDICSRMSDGARGATTILESANKDLKNAKLSNFYDLWLQEGTELDLNGHFVFDETFVDSLVKNHRVIEFSRRYAENRSDRGSGRGIKIVTKGLRAGQKAIWMSRNKGLAEYAVVGEPKGKFTVTVRDAKGNVLFAEPKHNKIGSNVRKLKIQLPEKSTPIYLEVRNCGKQDASFALLSN